MMLVICAYAKKKKYLTIQLNEFDPEYVVTDTKMKYFKYLKHDVYYKYIY